MIYEFYSKQCYWHMNHMTFSTHNVGATTPDRIVNISSFLHVVTNNTNKIKNTRTHKKYNDTHLKDIFFTFVSLCCFLFACVSGSACIVGKACLFRLTKKYLNLNYLTKNHRIVLLEVTGFSLELKQKHAANNCALASGHISTGRETLFGSQWNWTRGLSHSDTSRLAPKLAETTVPRTPSGLAQKSTLWGGDALNTSDFTEWRAIIYIRVCVYFYFIL